ncbi:MAG: hypothetical protein H6736_22050 [Alphaproteobacteria bacterium]|nr:hypothetical protein [Alphaproteobacteria bacterium]
MTVESVRVPAAQLALLQPYRVDHVLERHGQARYVAENLFYRGILSFDPNEVFQLTPAQEVELDFLCGIAKVIGLRGIEGVLDGLERPYAFPLSELVFDFTTGSFVVRAELAAEVHDAA